MKTFLALCLVAVSFTGCGGTLCERQKSVTDRFFAGKTECKGTQGLSLTAPATTSTCKSDSVCTSDEQKALSTYLDCAIKVTPCTAGNEDKALSELLACAVSVTGTLSNTCEAAGK